MPVGERGEPKEGSRSAVELLASERMMPATRNPSSSSHLLGSPANQNGNDDGTKVGSVEKSWERRRREGRGTRLVGWGWCREDVGGKQP